MKYAKTGVRSSVLNPIARILSLEAQSAHIALILSPTRDNGSIELRVGISAHEDKL